MPAMKWSRSTAQPRRRASSTSFFQISNAGAWSHVIALKRAFSAANASFQVEEVRVVSRSGLKQVAYDGEMGEKAAECVFGKREPLTVYCCRTD